MKKEKPDTILVVEDNLPMRKALTETLKILKYNTLEAGNGKEAIAVIESLESENPGSLSEKISLIMSDLSMPEMDGQELFYELKKQGNLTPFIMLTGFVVTDELDDLRRDGLAGWLLKPADIDQIFKLLKQILT